MLFRLFYSLIYLTCRKQYIGVENIDPLKRDGKNWIFSFWHNNISIAIWVLKNQNLISLVSASSDGEIAARLIQAMGNNPVRGSSSKGGIKALLSMIKLIKKGANGAITPDGPRGPKYEMQSGAIILAQKTGLPLIPLHIEATRQWVFSKSWDQHKLPKPFSTIIVGYGKPFHIPRQLKDNESESARADFEKSMMENVLATQLVVKNLRGRDEI